VRASRGAPPHTPARSLAGTPAPHSAPSQARRARLARSAARVTSSVFGGAASASAEDGYEILVSSRIPGYSRTSLELAVSRSSLGLVHRELVARNAAGRRQDPSPDKTGISLPKLTTSLTSGAAGSFRVAPPVLSSPVFQTGTRRARRPGSPSLRSPPQLQSRESVAGNNLTWCKHCLVTRDGQPRPLPCPATDDPKSRVRSKHNSSRGKRRAVHSPRRRPRCNARLRRCETKRGHAPPASRRSNAPA